MFNTIFEAKNYYPTCILCGKLTQFYIGGYENIKLPLWEHNKKQNKFVYIKTIIDGDYLKSLNNNYPVCIQTSNNKILEGEKLISKLIINHLEFYQKCNTCLFQIHFNFKSPDIKNNILPPLFIVREELIYTMNHEKNAIYTHYKDSNGSLIVNRNINYSVSRTIVNTHSDYDYKSFICVGNKELKYHNFKITNFKNIKKINKLIKTLLVFN